MREFSSRRRFVAAGAAGAIAAVAGCFGDDSRQASGETVDSLPTPVQGDPDADVTVAAYEDFTCPGCRQYKLTIYPDLREQFIETEEIRYEHHDFPVRDDDWAWNAPSAARAVQDEEGDDTFFEFVSALYEHQGDYSLDVIESVAEGVGASGESARSAADDLTYLPVIEASSEAGQERGVDSTPTVLLNGEELPINEDFYSVIADAVDSA